MSIINSIETARQAKIKDDAILNQIMTQNPNKVPVFEKALSRGATPTDIINEIIKQNTGKEAILNTGLDKFIEEEIKTKEQPGRPLCQAT